MSPSKSVREVEIIIVERGERGRGSGWRER